MALLNLVPPRASRYSTSKWSDITESLIIIYNEIDESEELATALGNPFTSTQLIAIRIHTIKQFNNFEKGLPCLFSRPTADKTWQRLKPYFESARAYICRGCGVTMYKTVYHQQTNAMTGKFLNEVRADNLQLLDEVKSAKGNILRANLTSECWEMWSKSKTIRQRNNINFSANGYDENSANHEEG